MDQRPIQSVFPPHGQCSRDKLHLHGNSDQDKELTESERASESYLIRPKADGIGAKMNHICAEPSRICAESNSVELNHIG